MAAYAAHLTRTLQGTPSVFQVTAQDALGATVKPALRKVIEYLAGVYPNRCGWCLEWFDELYLLFDLALQYYYLKHYAASFSERFYGLVRVPTTASQFHSGQRLPVALERGSLALLVLLPYLRDRVEGLVERWQAEDDDGLLGKSSSDRLRRAAVRVYSAAHLARSAAGLLQLARFATGRAAQHSAALAALGLTLRDAPPPAQEQWADCWGYLRGGNVWSALQSLPPLGGAVLRGAEYGAFLVQFLRWWAGRGAAARAALPPPPPPEKDERSFRMKNRCPICLQSWKIPTVLPVSGYTFCYVCVSRHVRARGTCPVSRLPCAEADLVRLYLDT